MPSLTLDVGRLNLFGDEAIPVVLTAIAKEVKAPRKPSGPSKSGTKDVKPDQQTSSALSDGGGATRPTLEPLETKAVFKMKWVMSSREEIPASWVHDRYAVSLNPKHDQRDELNFGLFTAFLADGWVGLGDIAFKRGDPERFVTVQWTDRGVEANRLWFGDEHKPREDKKAIDLALAVRRSREGKLLLDAAHRAKRHKLTADSFLKRVRARRHQRWQKRRERAGADLSEQLKASLVKVRASG